MRGSPEEMRELFIRSGIELDDRKLDLFYRFYLELIEKAPNADLTGLVSFEDIVVKHFIDSAIITKYVDLPSPLLDIGTGAGFPAVPLKIIRPEIKIYAAEGRKERVGFLMETIDLLGLDGIEIYPLRVKDNLPFKVRGVITRALEPIPETLIRTAPFLKEGDTVIFMKGPSAENEMEAIDKGIGRLFSPEEDISYTIPGTEYRRRLVIFERKGQKFVPGRDRSLGSKSPVEVKISSGKNPRFKELKSVLTGRGLKKGDFTILSGEKQVREALKTFPEEIEGIILSHERDLENMPEDIEDMVRYRLSKPLFNEIDSFGTGSPLLIIKVREIPEWRDENDAEWPSGITIFIPFQDPANVGGAVRTAVAFGVKRIVLLEGASNPYHVKSIRAAGTAIFRAPLFSGPKIEELKVCGAPLYSLDPGGESIARAVLPFNMGLVVGLEGPGLPENLRRSGGVRALSIPMVKGVESINATASLVAALFEWRRRHFTR
ncbi:MAG: 16S rRNA (guanine(527)-N(7))-methyltransferase RsmG [Deltaproteobacteria bacterium]|uniref:Ribosomal RNA small subunit methyltransferase G n=1 Tax=Candidatus Zymogenus saltonus TaxID=2844893 RepID=A0A9D8KHB1_9DELT|nr:16S rRNA (guanine(527)-N(7))-methyltransferase RsmG [Candidatus Zymogenus saltonus]